MFELTDEMIARACAVYLQQDPAFREELDRKIEAAGLTKPKPELTPSFRGAACLANGRHPGVECQCDECDFFLECFPDYREELSSQG